MEERDIQTLSFNLVGCSDVTIEERRSRVEGRRSSAVLKIDKVHPTKWHEIRAGMLNHKEQRSQRSTPE
jgi:hypothetical protein